MWRLRKSVPFADRACSRLEWPVLHRAGERIGRREARRLNRLLQPYEGDRLIAFETRSPQTRFDVQTYTMDVNPSSQFLFNLHVRAPRHLEKWTSA